MYGLCLNFITSFVFFNYAIYSGCDHLTIKENYYASPWIICGQSDSSGWQRVNRQYHSVGRSLTINFVFSQSYEYAFLLEFASVGKYYFISSLYI